MLRKKKLNDGTNRAIHVIRDAIKPTSRIIFQKTILLLRASIPLTMKKGTIVENNNHMTRDLTMEVS